jgi:hypothetical protein
VDFAIEEFCEMKMQLSLERALRHKEIMGAPQKKNTPDITLIVLQSHSAFMTVESKWC